VTPISVLKFTDPTGLYEFDASLGGDSSDGSVDRETRNKRINFRKGLQRAKDNVAKLKTTKGEKSTAYQKAKAAVDAYGEEGDKGVTVGVVGDNQQKTPGHTTGTKGNLQVTFKDSFLSQANGLGENKDIPGEMQGLIIHEGYHAATNAAKGYQIEHDAYLVQALVLEAQNPFNSYLDINNGSERVYIWDRSWNAVDIDANRENTIKRILEVEYPELKPTSGVKKR